MSSIAACVVNCFVVIALACGVSVAQDGPVSAWSGNEAEISPSDGSKTVVPAKPPNRKLKVIFSNLSDYKYGTYWCCTAEGVYGPNAGHGRIPEWRAVPFTPAVRARATTVETALYYYSGTNSAAIWLAADANDFPGATIAGPVDVNNMPSLYGCCQLTVAKFKGVWLEAGTQYWVVVGTDSHSEDATVLWNLNTTDMRWLREAYGNNIGWIKLYWNRPAVGVFGK